MDLNDGRPFWKYGVLILYVRSLYQYSSLGYINSHTAKYYTESRKI